MSFRRVLDETAAASGVRLEDRILDACDAHFELLVRWNRTHNLTRITDPEQAVRKHYLDCLLPLLAWPAPASFVDVGSGAGFPGLLAALAWPKAVATLVEPTAKRVSFLRLAAASMNVAVEVTSPLGGVRAERTLSRATFPPGEREQLVPYADESIAVWGHRPDLVTWKEEVTTWGPGWSVAARGYLVSGIEPRVLLTATRGEG